MQNSRQTRIHFDGFAIRFSVSMRFIGVLVCQETLKNRMQMHDNHIRIDILPLITHTHTHTQNSSQISSQSNNVIELLFTIYTFFYKLLQPYALDNDDFHFNSIEICRSGENTIERKLYLLFQFFFLKSLNT